MNPLDSLQGTGWAGTKELWLDPLGNEATTCPCTMQVDGNVIRYTWTYEGKTQEGSVTLHKEVADFTDTWHQAGVMHCRLLDRAGGLFQVQGTYGPDHDWGWRIGVSQRPSGELVMQMTNVAPWGEEGRAVRVVCSRGPQYDAA